MKQPNDRTILDLSKVDKQFDPIEVARKPRPYDHDESAIEERVSFTKNLMSRIEDDYSSVCYANESPLVGLTATDYLMYYYPAFVSDLDRWYWTVDAYMMDGYMFPREILEDLSERLPPVSVTLQDFPAELTRTHEEANLTAEELASMDAEELEFWKEAGVDPNGTHTVYEPVTVYRASLTEPDEMPYSECEFSWTLSLEKARWFAEHHATRRPVKGRQYHVYKGKLRPDDAIAYTNDRNEQEFIQLDSVYDIELME